MTITAIVVTKNETNSITRCLNSLKWCDQVIIIDDYSKDNTDKIAKQLGAQVYKRHLNHDFAAQRNFGLKKAKSDWVLFIDADEEVSHKLKTEIKNEITNVHMYQGYFIKRQNYFMGKKLNFGETAQVKLLRLAKRNSGKWHRPVHEVFKITGNTKILKNPLKHYPHQSIKEFYDHISRYAKIEADYRATPSPSKLKVLFELIFFPPAKFFLNYFFRLGFLDGFPGLIMASMMSLHSFLVRLQLYKPQKKINQLISQSINTTLTSYFFFAVILLTFSYYKIAAKGINLPDFLDAYYQSGQLLASHQSPYLASSPILYPPPALALLQFLHRIPPILAQHLWSLSSFITLLLSVWLAIKVSFKKYQQKWFLLLAPIFFLSFPAKFTLGMGQINHFVLLLFSSSAYYFCQKKYPLSALYLSSSLVIKLTPLWSLMLFLKNKSWRYLINVLLFAAFFLSLSYILLPHKVFTDFFSHTLPSFSSHLANSSYYNQSLSGLFSRLLSSPSTAAIILSNALLIVICWRSLVRRAPFPLKLGLLVILNTLISPVSWQHHLVFLFFPIIVLLAECINKKSWLKLSIVLAGYLLIFTNIKTHQSYSTNIWHQLLLSHGTIGALILLSLNISACLNYQKSTIKLPK